MTDIEQRLQYLEDRLAIEDVVMRHSRGFDRHDDDVMNSCFHDDAVARFGPRTITKAEYADFMNGAHTGRFALHSHHITTVNCEIDGDTAYVESYNLAAFLSTDLKRASYVSGRYLDEMEKRDGEWRIAKRRAFVDLVIEGDATYLGVPKGSPIDYDQVWSRKDLSYSRPLDLETPGPQWH
jgi:ketosteroid isomerase-like protein